MIVRLPESRTIIVTTTAIYVLSFSTLRNDFL